MFLHRKNVLKAHQHISCIVLYEEKNILILKKTILIQNLIKNIHQDTSNCTFLQNFLAG